MERRNSFRMDILVCFVSFEREREKKFHRKRGNFEGNFNSRDKCLRIFAEIRGKGGAWNDGYEMSVEQRENMSAGNQNYINNAVLSSLELTRPHLRLN